jgi:hypothetical protein
MHRHETGRPIGMPIGMPSLVQVREALMRRGISHD